MVPFFCGIPNMSAFSPGALCLSQVEPVGFRIVPPCAEEVEVVVDEEPKPRLLVLDLDLEAVLCLFSCLASLFSCVPILAFKSRFILL